MLYSDLGGTGIYGSNFRLRFLFIFLAGLLVFGSITYWRSQLLLSQEYVDFPQYKVHHHPQPTLIEKELNYETN